MSIVLDGSVGISSIGTLTGVTSISSAAADTPVILQDSSSNSNTCRAWVNFDGTGTPAIRADFNVSSITDNGTGDYTVNFTNAMPDVNYCVNASTQAGSGATTDIYPFTQNNGSGSYQPVNPATGSFRVTTAQTGNFTDLPFALVTVFR